VVKFAPLFGRIIICQLAFGKEVNKIENTYQKAATFVSNSCRGYGNERLKKAEWGWLGFELLNLIILCVLKYLSWYSSSESVWKPLKRLGDRMGREGQDGDA